jgi:hypothetical protein
MKQFMGLCTATVGVVLIVVGFALILSGCAKHQNETVDPKAFQIIVIGF